jgi:hypothetical protein
MKNYYKDNKLITCDWSIWKEEHKYWKGIEIISPPTNEYNALLIHVENIIKIILDNGGKVKRSFDNAFHIHIDASNLTFEQIKKMPNRIYDIQDSLTKFFTIDGINVPLYTKNEIKDLENIDNKDLYYKRYKRVNDEVIRDFDLRGRKIIDIGPYFYKPTQNKTIEFRCYSMSTNIEYIKECIYLSLDIYNYLLNGTEVLDLENRTKYIESLYRDSDS